MTNRYIVVIKDHQFYVYADTASEAVTWAINRYEDNLRDLGSSERFNQGKIEVILKDVGCEQPEFKPQPLRHRTLMVTRDPVLENSFGVVDSAKGVSMAVEVTLHRPSYASFEVYDVDTEDGESDWYAEGGLWIEDGKLTDYDGVYNLDDAVIEILESWGIEVDDDFRA